MKELQDWIAVPKDEFTPQPASMHIVLIDSRLPMLAQFIGPHWESIPNRNILDKGFTHILMTKNSYINMIMPKVYNLIPTIQVTEDVYELYNDMANIFTYGDEPVYDINNMLVKLQLINNSRITANYLNSKIGDLFENKQFGKDIRNTISITIWNKEQIDALVAEVGDWSTLYSMIELRQVYLRVANKEGESGLAIYIKDNLNKFGESARIVTFKPLNEGNEKTKT